NGMDEPIYVSDPETYELIYANRVLKDLFGPITGRKCYEYLQQRDKPCTFCTNEKIFNEQSDQSFVWEFQNTVNKRWYRCIDRAIPWPDGRTLRLEMAVDITERKQIEDSVHFDNSFRSLIAEASARFVQVKDNKDFDNAVDQVLASLGNLFKVDRSYLFRFSKNLSTMDNTHEWCAPGITSQKNRLQVFSLDCFNWWKTQIFKLHPVQISDVEMLPAEAGVEKEEFQYQGIQSLINLPICNDRKKLIGFLGFDAVSSPHIWPDKQLSMLQMLAEIIGNTIVRLEISNALSESEERLDRAMAVKNEGIWDWNLVTNETVFDDRYYTMAGYKPNEFPQNFSSWEKRVHPNDLAKSKTAIEAYLSGRTKRYDVEFRFKHKDGSWMWIRGRGKIVERDVNGSPLRMIGTHSNITEQKQIEGKLQAHYSMLKRTEAIANIGSWEWDIKKDEVRWSEEFFRIAKIPAENGAPSFAEQANLYVKEDYDKIRGLVEKCISNGTPYKTELRLIRKDGEIRHIIAQGQAKTDEKGEVCQLVGFVQDITERKQTEKKLEEERKRLEYILSITRTGINITDAEYNLQYVDDGWQKIYGDPSGRKCYEYFMGFSEPCQECGIPIALETKEVIVTEEKLPRENNRIVEVHTIPFKNSDEQWLVAEFNIDITERKKIEKEMERQVNTIQLLNQIISKGYSAKNTINYFQETLTVILCTLEYDGGSVILVDPDGETASVVCSKNIPEPFLDRMKKVSIDDNSMFTKLFRENEMIVVENFANNNPELARILGFNSFIISPIVTDEMIVGALHLASFDVHVFTESETILLKSITSQMGTIIKNVRAEEKLIEKLNELENWKKVTVGRELRMKELKKKIKGLDERC
ncbi:MAG: PAS domain-containing protein, partial [Candidatus Thermoplasmatota archaeon]|nr:PAS domain-containing protein [Candidatus Thermoplasmatota archaeon]